MTPRCDAIVVGPVVPVCGFSGHGFKFAPIIGRIPADPAAEGLTSHPIGFSGRGRFRRALSP